MSDKSNEEKPWLNVADILSLGQLFNMVFSKRNMGKTYGASILLLRECIYNIDENKRNHYLVWVRRKVDELKFLEDFTDDIAHEFSDLKFRKKGDWIEFIEKAELEYNLLSNDEKEESGEFESIWEPGWKKCIFLASVKRFTSYKGNKFNKYVYRICFDELIPELSSEYYHGDMEPILFTNLCHSFIRGKKKGEIQVLMLSNTISLFNPYLKFFKVLPSLKSEFEVFKKHKLAIQYAPDDKYRTNAEGNELSYFEEALQGTAYADMSLNNSFADNDNVYVEKRSKYAKPIASIKIDDVVIGVWFDFYSDYVYYSYKYDPKSRIKVSFNEYDDEEYVTYKNVEFYKEFEKIEKAKRLGQVRFEHASIKAKLVGIPQGRLFV